jgi:hypothetical protein
MQDPPKVASDTWQSKVIELIKRLKGHQIGRTGQLEQLLVDLRDEIRFLDFIAGGHEQQ